MDEQVSVMPSNAVMDKLAEILDRADNIEIQKGAKSWRLSDPAIPVELAVRSVKHRLEGLVPRKK